MKVNRGFFKAYCNEDIALLPSDFDDITELEHKTYLTGKVIDSHKSFALPMSNTLNMPIASPYKYG